MLHTLSIEELGRNLGSGQLSSVELTRHFLARIERLNPSLNAVITPTPELALGEAAVADRRRAAGETGPLLGIPLIHKDIFCTDGVRTSCGSRMLDNFISPYDATVVARLKAAGAVMLGKANMDEFAMGSSNETSYYGPVKNPWDLTKVPGGSSGGSAAAAAARLAAYTTGTDTGGSIRQPAALTGVTGVKPTYGRVSRYGMIAFASSLDQAGVLAESAADAALVLQAMAGFDPLDSTSVDAPVPDYHATLATPLKGLRLGLLREFFEGLEPRNAALIRDAIEVYTALGATTVEVSLPHLPMSVPTYYVVAPAECSSNLSRFDGVRYGYRCSQPKDLMDLYKRSRGEGFGAEVLRQAKRLLPSLRTLLLCHHTEVEYDRAVADVILPPEAGRAELLERAKILCIRKRGPTKKPPARPLPPFGSKSDGVHLSDLRAARERHGATDPSYWKMVNGERVHFDPNVTMGAEFLEYGPKKKGAA